MAGDTLENLTPYLRETLPVEVAREVLHGLYLAAEWEDSVAATQGSGTAEHAQSRKRADRLRELRTRLALPKAYLPGEVDYLAPTPETDAFMLLIDDSTIDLRQVEGQLRKLECERDTARNQVMQKDDLRAVSNLVWTVKKSRQNVGQRMLDAADSVLGILRRITGGKDGV